MTSFSLSQPTGAQTPSESDIAASGSSAGVRIGDECLSDMDDTALNQYIALCAERFFAAHRRYQETGCFADAGERDGWYRAEASALIERGNRPHIVKAMEQERGLCGR